MKKLCSVLLTLSMLLLQLQMFSPIVSASEPIEFGRTMLVSEDFSDTTKYVVGTAYTGDLMATKNDNLVYYYDGFSKNTAASFTVKQIDENDASKGKYLEFGHGTVNKHSVIGGNFDTVTKGTLVTEMKLRIPDLSSSPARNKVFICGFRGTETANTLRYEASATANPTFSRIRGETDNCIFDTTNVTDKLAKDENGFYSMRFVWNRETTSDNWDVKLYDAYTGKVVLSNNSVSMTDITNIRFAQEYAVNTDSNAPIDLADIKVYLLDDISLVADGKYNFSNGTAVFTPSSALPANVLEGANVVVTDASGNEVDASASYTDGKLTITTAEKLVSSGTYNVDVTNVLTNYGLYTDMSGSFTVSTEDAVGDIVLVEEDFSDTSIYTLNNPYTYVEMQGKNPSMIYNWTAFTPDASSKPFTIKQLDENDPTKGNYLEINHTTNHKHVMMGADFGDVKKGTLAVEFKLRTPDEAVKPLRTMTIGTFKDSANNSANTLTYIGSGNDATPRYEFRNKTDGTPVFGSTGTELKNKLKKDEYGFYNLKFIWSRATENDKWEVKLCDALNDDTVLLHTEAFPTTTTFNDISAILLAHAYEMDNERDGAIGIADLKVYLPDLKDSTVFKDIKFTSNNVEIDALPSTATDLSVSLVMRDVDIRAKSYSVILAVYEKDGTIEAVKSISGITTDDGNSKQLSLGLENLHLSEGAYAKLFFWRGMSTLYPLGVPEELPAAGF